MPEANWADMPAAGYRVSDSTADSRAQCGRVHCNEPLTWALASYTIDCRCEPHVSLTDAQLHDIWQDYSLDTELDALEWGTLYGSAAFSLYIETVVQLATRQLPAWTAVSAEYVAQKIAGKSIRSYALGIALEMAATASQEGPLWSLDLAQEAEDGAPDPLARLAFRAIRGRCEAQEHVGVGADWACEIFI